MITAVNLFSPVRVEWQHEAELFRSLPTLLFTRGHVGNVSLFAVWMFIHCLDVNSIYYRVQSSGALRSAHNPTMQLSEMEEALRSRT